MSARVMGKVFDRYARGGGEFTLALALADNAHDDGTHIFPSVAELARKSRQSQRAVQYQLRTMEKAGWLIKVCDEIRPRGPRAPNGASGGRPREYRISPDWLSGRSGATSAPDLDDLSGANVAPEEAGDKSKRSGANVAPEPAEIGCKMEQRSGAKLLHPNHQLTINKSFCSASASTQSPGKRISAQQAWAEARAAMANGERPPRWSDARIEPALVAMGGFYPLSQHTVKDLDWKARDFAVIFDSLPRDAAA